jgi:SAM-dependent methyltransferase
MDLRDSYDAAAAGYAEELFGELARKPLDRHLLNRFAEALRGEGLVADLGCGPGQVGRYLHDQGLSVVGADLSPGMIAEARRLNPEMEFRVADMRELDFDDGSLAGIVAFYAIVHFAPEDLTAIFREMRRVLRDGGLALVAFHAGDQVVHVDELFGASVSLDFRFHVAERVIESLAAARLEVIEDARREPYEGVEHQSRRCYLLARAV